MIFLWFSYAFPMVFNGYVTNYPSGRGWFPDPSRRDQTWLGFRPRRKPWGGHDYDRRVSEGYPKGIYLSIYLRMYIVKYNYLYMNNMCIHTHTIWMISPSMKGKSNDHHLKMINFKLTAAPSRNEVAPIVPSANLSVGSEDAARSTYPRIFRRALGNST